MENEMENIEIVSNDSWFKILGIGEKGCKIVPELSKKRQYLQYEFFSIGREGFICIKGLRDIDRLQDYLINESIVWYVTSEGRAYRDAPEEVLRVTHPKVDYSLLFCVGEVDKDFVYSLITSKIYK